MGWMLLAVFSFVICLMPMTWLFAWKIGAVDVPKDWRRMHRKSIPRNGGLAIGLGFFLGCALIGIDSPFWGYTVGLGAVILGLGLIDDVNPLPARVKLLIQMVCSLTVVGKGIGARGWEAFGAFFWILLLTNAHKFIDGLDGWFCGCAALGAVRVSLFFVGLGMPERAALSAALAVALLGFRVFNRHPAVIFAGDCGSGSVGFWLGVMSWDLFRLHGGVEIPMLPLLIFAYPLADLAAAVLRRILRGKSPFYADRGHLHHRICDAGISSAQCARILLTISFCFCALSLLIGVWSRYELASIACLTTACLLMLMRHRIVRRNSF